MTVLMFVAAFWFTFLVGTGFGVWLHYWMARPDLYDADGWEDARFLLEVRAEIAREQAER